MKKVVSFLLIFSLLISCLPSLEPVEAATKTTVENFDLSIYRANEYLRKGSVCNNIIRELEKGENLPSQVIVRDLNSKQFQKSVAAWEAAHWLDKSPAEIAQGEIDKKGYYEAILLSIFISESKLDNSLFDMGKTVTAETNQILSTTRSWMKKSDEIGMTALSDKQKISKLSSAQKKQLQKKMSDLFKKQHPLLAKSDDIVGTFNDVFAAADTVYDAVNKMAYYTNACELSSQTKNLVQLMYKECPATNLPLKEALRELKESMDGFNSGIKAEIQSVVIDQASKVLSELVDAGWEKVVNANPYVAAFSFGGKIGTKIGDSICNTLFSTDKTIEQYEKMRCLGEFQLLLSSSAKKLGQNYQKNRTDTNAENYFAAIDALFATANLSCKFGTEYADILYNDATLGWMAISKKSYSKFLSDIKSIQNTYKTEQKSLITNYLASLKVDYPTVYRELIFGKSSKTNTKKSNKEANKKNKKIETAKQKNWEKAYINAINDWKKRVNKWEKEHANGMLSGKKNRSEAVLVHITDDKIPQMIYYYNSSVVVFYYINGSVGYFGIAGAMTESNVDDVDFLYSSKSQKGYFLTTSSSGEEISLYSLKKGKMKKEFSGRAQGGNYLIFQSGSQRKMESVNAIQYYERFAQYAGNEAYKRGSEQKLVSEKTMRKKLHGK